MTELVLLDDSTGVPWARTSPEVEHGDLVRTAASPAARRAPPAGCPGRRRSGPPGSRRSGRSRRRRGPRPARRAAARGGDRPATGPARAVGRCRWRASRPAGGRRSVRPTRSRQLSATGARWSPAACGSSAAVRTLSRTVSDPNSSRRWKVRAMPARARLCALRSVMSVPVQQHQAAGGRLEPGDHVEGGGLAGAVGPDQAGDGALGRRSGSPVRPPCARRSGRRPHAFPGSTWHLPQRQARSRRRWLARSTPAAERRPPRCARAPPRAEGGHSRLQGPVAVGVGRRP